MDWLKQHNPGEDEFLQAVYEVGINVLPFLLDHAQYTKVGFQPVIMLVLGGTVTVVGFGFQNLAARCSCPFAHVDGEPVNNVAIGGTGSQVRYQAFL
jgi:hypothetical protein